MHGSPERRQKPEHPSASAERTPSPRPDPSGSAARPVAAERASSGLDVWGFRRRESVLHLTSALCGAFLAHAAVAAPAVASLLELRGFAEKLRDDLDPEQLDIEIEPEETPEPEPEAPPEPEPEPEAPPEPEPVPLPSEPPPQSAPEEPAPAAAQAGQVLTAEPDPNEPVDLTDMGFVTGTGDRYAGGVTASAGTSKTAVRNRAARPDGKIGGTGTGPARPATTPAVDRSRSPRPESMSWASCGFPAEAEMEQIDHAVATIVATVGSDGIAKSVTVVSDPGFGFGRLAKSCAMRRRWIPGLDTSGKPITKTSPPVRIRFDRN